MAITGRVCRPLTSPADNLTLSALLVVVASAQQSHPQLQAYLAQQQQLQQQQLSQQPARQQYRLLQQPQVQQYSSEDDSSAQQYQQLPQLSPQLYRAQAAAAQPQQPQLSPAAIARLRAAQAAQQQTQGGTPLENPEDYDPNPQYQFGFDVKDDQFTNYQNRKEQRDGDKISGSYSVVDSDGFIRTVTYTADPKEGFKAEVTRTPTDIVVKLPTPPPQQLTEAAGLQRQLAARQQQYEQPAQPVQYSSRPAAYSVAPQQHSAATSPQQLQQLLAAQQRPLLRAAAASPSAAYQTYQQQ